jgi:hypothetical protein
MTMKHEALDKHWAIWWLLERFYGFRNAGHAEIGFLIRTFDSQPGQPNYLLQTQALEELAKAHVLSVERTNDDNSPRGRFYKDYKIVPQDPEFTNWYEKYKQAMELPADLHKYLPTGKELNSDPPLTVKEKLKDEYVIFYNQKGLEFFQGMARYTNILAKSKATREILDKHLRPDRRIGYWPGQSYGTVDIWMLFYQVYLAFYAKITNREDLAFLGFNLYSAALHEVTVYDDPSKHAPIFKITEDKFRRYIKDIHAYVIPELEKSVVKIEEIKPVVNLPKDAAWDYVEIKFRNESEVEVRYKGKFNGSFSHIDLRFQDNKTKDKRPNKQWQFLYQLSIIQQGIIDKHGKKQMIAADNDTMRKVLKTTKNGCEQIKLNLSKQLQEDFGLSALDPFYEYTRKNSYETRFKLTPEPMLRHKQPEFYTSQLDDEINYTEPIAKRMSKRHSSDD